MRWYCTLTESLLDEGNIDPEKEPPTLLLKELRTKLVALYKAILLYQMKSVRYYYRNQPWNFVLQLGKADDWDATLQSIKDIEDHLQKDSEWYYKEDTKKSLHKFVESAGAMKAQLGVIGQTLKDFVTSQEQLHQHDKAMKCLRDLRAGAVDPRDDMDRIENQKEDLLPDVYGWIIRTNQYAAFTNWDESGLPLTRLLWINGLAGRGKTMIMIGIIRNLLAQSAVLAPSLSYFFCQGTGTSKMNRATVMLRSLIWMLLIQQPQLISNVQTLSENSGQIFFNDFFALRRMFRNMLKDPTLSPVYLIIDGLDECDTTEIGRGMEKLLEIVTESITASDKVKWLLCSRPEVDGLAELMNPDDGITFVELNDEVLKAPVKLYIEQKLDSFETLKGYDSTVLAALRKEVYDQAKNTFLWVALALKALEKVHGSRAIARLKEMPTGLRELYDHMMTRIEKAEIAEPEDCKKVLVATLLAARQLSLPELAILADLPVDLTETAVEKCGSFLIFKKNTLNLIHQTAKEYLTDNFGKLEKAGIGEGHLTIARRSIEAMSSTLKQNNYNLQPGSKRQDLTPLDSDPLAGIQYSCVFWANHLCYTNDESADCKTAVSEYKAAIEFLEDHLLHWLEALGWMGKVPEGINSLILLESTTLVSRL
jgi:N-terminal domain of NWD NACHT-NTPase/NACHT domain